MQVTKVTDGFQNQAAERKQFADEELKKEFDYYSRYSGLQSKELCCF